MTRSIGRFVVTVTGLLVLILIVVALDGTIVVRGAPISAMPAPFHLDLSIDESGGMAEAALAFDPANSVRGFNLLLQFESGYLLSAAGADFERNEAFFPVGPSIGGQQLNRVLDAGAGRIRIVGLAPVQATGKVEVGRLHMHVAPSAPIGATQLITATGEINDAIQGVTTIEPVVAVFQVRESDLSPTPTAPTSPTPPRGTSTPTVTPTPPAGTFHHIYLPLLERAYAR